MNDSTKEKIRELINSDRVVLFMKGTKDFPQCGFSNVAVEILKRSGLKSFTTVNVLADYDVREGVKEFSQWPTIPQLYLNGSFVGGSDILRDLYERGEFSKLVQEALDGDRKLV